MAVLDSNRVTHSPEIPWEAKSDDNPPPATLGLRFRRVYTQKGVDPFSTVE